jgi:1-acyl-sn-glycerol-3-phosphate acyltransferase
MFWWMMKYIFLGPVLRVWCRPTAEGLENIPDGPAILAANHQSFLDNLLLPLVVKRRRVVFLGKAEYFDKWYLRWFFKGAGVIPIRRESRAGSELALGTAVEALRSGKLIGIFPEGTRSPDGRLFRGKTGVARLALDAQVPIVPVAIVGTYRALPYNRKLPRPGRITVRFGKPLDFERSYGTPTDRFVLRSVTDEVMYEIMLLSGQEYVDEYGSKMKTQLERAAKRKGDPEPVSSEEGASVPSRTGSRPA